jgi:Flp pilus assembly protein TadG
MRQKIHRASWRKARGLWREEQAAQIVEFAVSLPLLVVFVVGIFDFSGAYTLKQKLANAAREGARASAAAPANDLVDLSTAVPVAVGDAFQVVDNYLISQKINDCGLSSSTATNTSPSLTWQYTATGNGCVGSGVTLTINRGFVTTQTVGGNTINIVNTQVTIQYPYAWRFNRVIGLLSPGATYPGVTTLSSSATALNEN